MLVHQNWKVIVLTHWGIWGRDKMAAISQTTFSNGFSWMKIYEFQLKFHWSLFLRVQLTIFQHWFRWWLGADEATSHYLNQWWLVYRRIYASLGLNELTAFSSLKVLKLICQMRKGHVPFQYDDVSSWISFGQESNYVAQVKLHLIKSWSSKKYVTCVYCFEICPMIQQQI